MTDPIADMLTRIRNAYLAGNKSTTMPFSNVKLAIANLLVEGGYLSKASKAKEGNHYVVEVNLKYIAKQPAISNITRVSMPGRRIYVKSTKLPRPLSGYGMAIISTSQGVMSAKTAQEKKLGGELICKVW